MRAPAMQAREEQKSGRSVFQWIRDGPIEHSKQVHSRKAKDFRDGATDGNPLHIWSILQRSLPPKTNKEVGLVVDFLKQVPLLAGADEPALRRAMLRCCAVVQSALTSVFCLGDAADSFYIVVQGTLSIQRTRKGKKNQHRKLAKIGPKSCFGELGLISGSPRSATVHAVSECFLLKIDEQAFTETVGPYVVANIKNIVRDVSMFPVLSAESPSRSIELAYKFRRSDFVPGETVMIHSSASRPAQNELHFILAGQVAIYAQQQHTSATVCSRCEHTSAAVAAPAVVLRPGEVVGDWLLPARSSPIAAHAVALTEVTTIQIATGSLFLTVSHHTGHELLKQGAKTVQLLQSTQGKAHLANLDNDVTMTDHSLSQNCDPRSSVSPLSCCGVNEPLHAVNAAVLDLHLLSSANSMTASRIRSAMAQRTNSGPAAIPTVRRSAPGCVFRNPDCDQINPGRSNSDRPRSASGVASRVSPGGDALPCLPSRGSSPITDDRGVRSEHGKQLPGPAKKMSGTNPTQEASGLFGRSTLATQEATDFGTANASLGNHHTHVLASHAAQGQQERFKWGAGRACPTPNFERSMTRRPRQDGSQLEDNCRPSRVICAGDSKALHTRGPGAAGQIVLGAIGHAGRPQDMGKLMKKINYYRR